MINLTEELSGASTVAIAGHIRPDGDAVGSCLGLYLYVSSNYPEIKTTVYFEQIPEAFHSLSAVSQVCYDMTENKTYDVFFCLDCSNEERLGNAAKYMHTAKKTICIDHHISNTGFADVDYIVPTASSTSELITSLLEPDRITREAAEALYMGIAHDTGVFRHSCTSPATMRMAALLLEKDIDGSKIINETFYDKTYYQNQILGRALLESILLLDGKIIFSAVRMKEMEFFGVEPSDLDGIVSCLMSTKGVEAAIFLYEINLHEFKVSMRSRECIDVSVIASAFGGGGHVRAAGCTMQGSVYDVVNNITAYMEKQLNASKEEHNTCMTELSTCTKR